MSYKQKKGNVLGYLQKDPNCESNKGHSFREDLNICMKIDFDIIILFYGHCPTCVFCKYFGGLLFQHPSMAIVKGAGMVMKAVIEVSQWKSDISFSLLFVCAWNHNSSPRVISFPEGYPTHNPPPPSMLLFQHAESDVRWKNGWLHRKGGGVGGRESGE